MSEEARQTAEFINKTLSTVFGWAPALCLDGHDDSHIPPGCVGICLRCYNMVSKDDLD